MTKNLTIRVTICSVFALALLAGAAFYGSTLQLASGPVPGGDTFFAAFSGPVPGGCTSFMAFSGPVPGGDTFLSGPVPGGDTLLSGPVPGGDTFSA
jgi:hypothetical protein